MKMKKGTLFVSPHLALQASLTHLHEECSCIYLQRLTQQLTQVAVIFLWFVT